MSTHLVRQPVCQYFFLALIILFCVTGPASAESQFKVGIITSLSGPAAPFGVSIRNSMELAAEDHPELFSRIRFIYEDVGYDTKQAVSAFHKLINVDKVNLVYTWGLNFCKALAPEAESRRVPLVAQCLLPDLSKDKRYVLRFYSSTDDYMKLQSEYLDARALKRIALITTDTPHLHEMAAALRRQLRAGEEIILDESLLPTDMDFKATIGKIFRSKADVVAVFLSVGQISTFYKQARSLSLKLPTFGSNWLDSQQEVDAAAGTMEGASFVTTAFKEEFQKRYEARFKQPGVLTFGGPAYELALKIGQLFGVETRHQTPEQIIETLGNLPAQDGQASGPFYPMQSATEGRFIRFPVILKEIRNSRIVPVSFQ